METPELSFEGFLFDVNPALHPFVHRMHELLMGAGCALKLQMAKNGYVVSYNHPTNKRVLLNYVFRSKGRLFARVYGDHCAEYEDYLQTMPEPLAQKMAKCSNCKRLLDPAKCSSSCPKGYAFTLNGEELKKCRFHCFLIEVNEGSEPFLAGLVERELKARY